MSLCSKSLGELSCLKDDTLRERRTSGGQERVDRKHLTPSEETSATQSGKSYSVLEKVSQFGTIEKFFGGGV